jgi:membrane fusion protein (multidrug efflux system)
MSVRSGVRLAERVEILEGLKDNYRVVTRGFLGLRDGKTVQIVKHTPVKSTS